MNKLSTILFIAMMCLAVGCAEPYDDSGIRADIEDLKERVTTLEEICRKMNSNIEAMQTIVNALQNNDYITSVTPVTDGDETIGYTITFAKSSSIIIYHGTDGKDGADGGDGKDGYAPQIGVKQDTDNIYYWTIDGEWLLDENGNKIKAQGSDGKDGEDGADGENGNDGINGEDGKDGITPQLKIDNDYWYVSYDNGQSWTQHGKATGEKGEQGETGAQGPQGEKGDKGDTGLIGDSMFADVDYSNVGFVIFILSNGTQVKVPTWSAFEALSILCNQMNTNIIALQKIVTALQNNDYVTKVEPAVDNGNTIGYTIYFTKSNPVTIYHGKDGANGADGADGKDGYTPVIGVRQDTDNIYYWTLNGEWLTDASGNKIKAIGIDGANGNDGPQGPQGEQGEQGITPQLKIENGKWHISYDNGSTWNEVGQATGNAGADGADGKDGDAFFQSVDSSNSDYVVITLTDGTKIKLPTWSAFEALRTLCNQMNTNISALQKIVTAMQNNDYVTKV